MVLRIGAMHPPAWVFTFAGLLTLSLGWQARRTLLNTDDLTV